MFHFYWLLTSHLCCKWPYFTRTFPILFIIFPKACFRLSYQFLLINFCTHLHSLAALLHKPNGLLRRFWLFTTWNPKYLTYWKNYGLAKPPGRVCVILKCLYLKVWKHVYSFSLLRELIIPYPTAFPYGNGMVLHFYQQQESSTTKTVHKVINKGLKTYV